MVPWWFSSIVLMCFARCAVTRRPSAGGAFLVKELQGGRGYKTGKIRDPKHYAKGMRAL